MKKINNLKGELTTQQIVMLIILMASFAIILFFFFKLNLGEETQKSICHNSVVLKSKGNSFTNSGTLDCKINYLCVSGGAECDGISSTETIEVDIEDKNEIFEALANEMADCWWMFGEGKLDYSKDWNALDNAACSVCSIVSFDSRISEDEKISYNEFYKYLQETKKDKSQTYLNYLYGTDSKEDLGEYLDNSFDTNKEYFILTALREKGEILSTIEKYSAWRVIKLLPPIAATRFAISSLTEDGKIELESMPVVIFERNQTNYDKIGCDEFLTKP